MKILIGSLLFATAIFINFPELNSSPQPSSGAGPSRVNYDMDRFVEEEFVPPHVYINLFGQKIDLEIGKLRNRYTAIGCKVQRPRFRMPTRKTRRSMNFMTLADFKSIQTGNVIRIVVYVREDEHKVRTLLGAKLPPPPGIDLFEKGDPRNLNPDHTKWFITYEGVDYEVEVDPITQNHIDIKPRVRENLRPSLQMIKEYWHSYPFIKFGGLYFFVFKDADKVVQGAALDPFWSHRPGEDYQNENPHINPHIRPQRNHPIEQNSEPEQTFEEQYQLEHQEMLNQHHHFDPRHNAYQQQNLYQNPYPHAHPIADPNQIPQYPHLDSSEQYRQQRGFQTFGSQHYPQQGGSETPHLNPNQNWYYQPHPPPSP